MRVSDWSSYVCSSDLQVVVVNYGGRASDIWWDKIASSLTRLKNLTVIDLPAEVVDALPGIGERGMRLNALVQAGELQLMGERGSTSVRQTERMGTCGASARGQRERVVSGKRVYVSE